jgi:RNA polymerase primary sigma factor
MSRLLRRKSRPAQHPLETYVREINGTPLLTADEERELAYRVEEGDTEARDHMVRANLRLVVNIARCYAATGLGLQDLIEEGNLGLMRAVEGFDPSMNVRFSTYAVYWIKQSMKRGVVNSGKTIRLPAYTVGLLTKWRRAAAQLHDELSRTPSPEEVADCLHMSARQLKIVKKALIIAASPVQNHDERPLAGTLGDDHCEVPDARMARSDDLSHALGLLDKLGSREGAVLRLRFGLDGEEPKTLAEVGDRLGLTRERVRQIERDALGKLREGLESA